MTQSTTSSKLWVYEFFSFEYHNDSDFDILELDTVWDETGDQVLSSNDQKINIHLEPCFLTQPW